MEATVRLSKPQTIKNDDGKYNVHVYYVDQSDKRNYITETTTEVHHVKPSGTLTIENNNVETGTFDAVIRNVVAPNGLKEVLIPTWSDKNWQDDLVWHKAVRQSDGSYRATIKASDHKKNEDGKYNVHVYYVDQNNQRNYITETTTEVRQARRSGTILIQNNNKDTGTFDVIIRMYTVLKVCGLFKFLHGRIRMDRMISAGTKRLVKQTETTRYRSKRAIIRTLLVNTIFTFITFKMMVLV